MKSILLICVLALASLSACAQQNVVRDYFLPTSGIHCVNSVSANFIRDREHLHSDQCQVVVYNVQETQAHIDAAKGEAITACKQNIDIAKAALAKDINNLPSAAVAALRAEIKSEIKAEVIKEVIDEIKAGKIILPIGVPKSENH